MALLSDDGRRAMWADIMRRFPPALGGFGLTKGELRVVLDALDDHIEANGEAGAAASISADLSDDWKAWLADQVVAARAPGEGV